MRARSLSLQQLQDQEVVPNEGECMIGKVRRSDRRAGALAYVLDTRPLPSGFRRSSLSTCGRRVVRTGGRVGGAGALAYVRDTRPPLVLGIPQVFDATEEDCPQNIRIFINAVGLLMSNVLGASQSVK